MPKEAQKIERNNKIIIFELPTINLPKNLTTTEETPQTPKSILAMTHSLTPPEQALGNHKPPTLSTVAVYNRSSQIHHPNHP